MTEIIFVFIFLVPAMLGTAELLHILKLYIAFPGKGMCSYSVIFLGNEDFAEKIKYACDQLLWYGKRYTKQIIAVDTGLSPENREAALTLTRRYNTVFCDVGSIERLFEKIRENDKN